MRLRKVAFLLVVCLGLGSSWAFRAEAAGILLRYKLQPGQHFGYAMKTWANVPLQRPDQPVKGEVTGTAQARYTVTGGGQDLALLKGDLSWSSGPGTPAGSTACTLQVNDLGQVSNLQSPDMNDPAKAMAVKNVIFYFPHVPPEPVNIGAGWTWPTALYMPRGDVETGKDVELKLDVAFTLKGVTVESGRQLAQLQAVGKERPGQKYQVSLAGPMVFDINNGRLSHGYLEGELKAKLAVFTITIPVKFWLNPGQ